MTQSKEIVMADLSSIKFFEKNPKKFTSKQYGRLLNSIKREGILQPLTVNKKTNRVLDGNQRLKCAMQLLLKEVPVHYINVSEADEPKFIAYFNKTRADFDDEMFKELLKQYESDDYFKELLTDYKENISNQFQQLNPEFQIVAEVDEQYHYVMFVTKKSVDHLNIETFFNLRKVYDPHKNKLIGMGRVIDGEALNRLIEIATKHGYKNISEI